ncbi:MAG: acyl phosphate:glycerol-3-phosphate acyltransferase [Candidatus Diapherotrites archaeon]|nr:acyl phosphate:glycerol-3-phosphate acyltransferase [Candidatus Diapherotrites archaeon]MDN5366788.1 acyl phosphate:glycerol-3-phosphate acyltransferase [Candidatus Diapherotrites archaeon]
MYAAAALISYLLGSIPTAYIAVKLATGKNIWEVGSRNVGALNTYRATGSKILFVAVVVLDVLKAILALWIVQNYFPSALWLAPFFIVLGHNYPVWTRFRGGRGIAVMLASALYLDWKFAVIWAALWAVGYAVSGYIAVGAMLGHIFTPAIYYVLFGSVPEALVLALIPVWLRYREKAELLVRGELPKHYWGGKG